MLICTLGSTLLGNLLTGERVVRAGEVTIRTGGVFNAASSFK